MFTGIIDHCGTLTRMESIPNGVQLWIKHSFNDLERGESISVDGICLTVTQFQEDIFCCDVSSETLTVTTAKNFVVGQSVNLERALQLHSRLGGHFVMGHVDQVAYIKKRQRHHDFIEMELTGFDETAKKYLIKKGSISINGVSLTINQVTAAGPTVMLIPHTLERTNLSTLQEGDAVNIEFDILIRIVVEQQRAYT